MHSPRTRGRSQHGLMDYETRFCTARTEVNKQVLSHTWSRRQAAGILPVGVPRPQPHAQIQLRFPSLDKSRQ